MNKRNTLFSATVSIVLLSQIALPPRLWSADSLTVHPRFDLAIVVHHTPESSVSGFPLSIRAVPRHQDDRYSGPYATDPLPDTTLALHRTWAYGYSLTYSPRPSIGFGLQYLGRFFDNGPCVDSDQRYQQNQYGTNERGYGTALRWYQTKIESGQLQAIAFFATPWGKAGKKLRCRVKAGGVYDITGVSLNAESGWDRYNMDEHWKSVSVGRLHEHSIFGRVEVGIAPYPDPRGEGVFYLFLQPQWMIHDMRSRNRTPAFHIDNMGTFVIDFGIGANMFRL